MAQTRGLSPMVLAHGGGAVREILPEPIREALIAEGICASDALVERIVRILADRAVSIDGAPLSTRSEMRADSVRRSREKTAIEKIEDASKRLLEAIRCPEWSDLYLSVRWEIEDRTGRPPDEMDFYRMLTIMSDLRGKVFVTDKPANGYYNTVLNIRDAIKGSGKTLSVSALGRVLVKMNNAYPHLIFSPETTNFDKSVRAAIKSEGVSQTMPQSRG